MSPFAYLVTKPRSSFVIINFLLREGGELHDATPQY